MRRGKIAESALVAATVALVFCAAPSCSDHHVSPWGDGRGPTLRPFFPRPDLAARLGEIDAETSPLGLTRELEIAGELPRGGGAVVLRSYVGRDVTLRPIHAVRVAVPRGVVMAVGPLDARDLVRETATELVQALPRGSAVAYRPLIDLNHDGSPDVLLRSESGALEIWGIAAMGASPYPIEMAVRPTLATDVDGDGQLDFAGFAPRPVPSEGDALTPLLEDVATFEAGAYSPVTRGAFAFHEQKLEALDLEARIEAAAVADAAAPDAGALDAGAPDGGSADAGAAAPVKVPDSVRLGHAIERAWHAILAGHPREAIFKTLDREVVPPALRTTFAAYRRLLDRLPDRATLGARAP